MYVYCRLMGEVSVRISKRIMCLDCTRSCILTSLFNHSPSLSICVALVIIEFVGFGLDSGSMPSIGKKFLFLCSSTSDIFSSWITLPSTNGLLLLLLLLILLILLLWLVVGVSDKITFSDWTLPLVGVIGNNLWTIRLFCLTVLPLLQKRVLNFYGKERKEKQKKRSYSSI